MRPMMGEAGSGCQRDDLQAQAPHRHCAEGRSMGPEPGHAFSWISSIIGAGGASSCDAVRSLCLWAQHATSFWSAVPDAERQQPASVPR